MLWEAIKNVLDRGAEGVGVVQVHESDETVHLMVRTEKGFGTVVEMAKKSPLVVVRMDTWNDLGGGPGVWHAHEA